MEAKACKTGGLSEKSIANAGSLCFWLGVLLVHSNSSEKNMRRERLQLHLLCPNNNQSKSSTVRVSRPTKPDKSLGSLYLRTDGDYYEW